MVCTIIRSLAGGNTGDKYWSNTNWLNNVIAWLLFFKVLAIGIKTSAFAFINGALCLCIRLHNAVQSKQKEKQTITQLEKRLKSEQDARSVAEKQLNEEKKRKKVEEAMAARAVALTAASR